MDKQRTVITGLDRDPGPGRNRVERGYVIASPRTWRRIEIEYSAGASAAWLSARYGPAERTIAARAKHGRWRKKDVALRAEAGWDAEEAAAKEAAGARAAWLEAAISGEDGGVDLARAGRVAQVRAIEALERGDARAAQDFLKLARMLAGDGEMDGAEARTPQEEAALAAILARLGVEG